MSDNSTPVVATKTINGVIAPGTIFVPAEHELDVDELRALDAVQDCSEAEIALAEQQAAQTAAPAKRPSKADLAADAEAASTIG